MVIHRHTYSNKTGALCEGIPEGHAAEYSLIDSGVTCPECLELMIDRTKKLEQLIIDQQMEIENLKVIRDQYGIADSILNNLTSNILRGFVVVGVEEGGYEHHIQRLVLKNKYGDKLVIFPHVDCMTWEIYKNSEVK